jgi:hypothetical protein
MRVERLRAWSGLAPNAGADHSRNARNNRAQVELAQRSPLPIWDPRQNVQNH